MTDKELEKLRNLNHEIEELKAGDARLRAEMIQMSRIQKETERLATRLQEVHHQLELDAVLARDERDTAILGESLALEQVAQLGAEVATALEAASVSQRRVVQLLAERDETNEKVARLRERWEKLWIWAAVETEQRLIDTMAALERDEEAPR
jgi:hypothetical protein